MDDRVARLVFMGPVCSGKTALLTWLHWCVTTCMTERRMSLIKSVPRVLQEQFLRLLNGLFFERTLIEGDKANDLNEISYRSPLGYTVVIEDTPGELAKVREADLSLEKQGANFSLKNGCALGLIVNSLMLGSRPVYRTLVAKLCKNFVAYMAAHPECKTNVPKLGKTNASILRTAAEMAAWIMFELPNARSKEYPRCLYDLYPELTRILRHLPEDAVLFCESFQNELLFDVQSDGISEADKDRVLQALAAIEQYFQNLYQAQICSYQTVYDAATLKRVFLTRGDIRDYLKEYISESSFIADCVSRLDPRHPERIVSLSTLSISLEHNWKVAARAPTRHVRWSPKLMEEKAGKQFDKFMVHVDGMVAEVKASESSADMKDNSPPQPVYHSNEEGPEALPLALFNTFRFSPVICLVALGVAVALNFTLAVIGASMLGGLFVLAMVWALFYVNLSQRITPIWKVTGYKRDPAQSVWIAGGELPANGLIMTRGPLANLFDVAWVKVHQKQILIPKAQQFLNRTDAVVQDTAGRSLADLAAAVSCLVMGLFAAAFLILRA